MAKILWKLTLQNICQVFWNITLWIYEKSNGFLMIARNCQKSSMLEEFFRSKEIFAH